MSMLDIEKRLKRYTIEESAKSVVTENDTWNVYKATDETSMKKYGRDATWAMPKMWDKYVEDGLKEVYVFIKKGEIDRRGKTDKYAVCVYSNGQQEIFDQQDELVKTVPNSAGISLPGVKLGTAVKESIKITKSELKEMIREALRKELSAKNQLKESVSSMSWEDLLVEADELLEELCIKSGNDAWDDGDGYWQEEYTTWCFRYLYHETNLPNVTEVEKLCAEYSKKLPNITFYCIDDEYCSEIGYVAER